MVIAMEDGGMTAAVAPDQGTLFERYRELLDDATAAARARGYWSAFPESPSTKIWGADAPAAGQLAFSQLLGRRFELDQPATDAWVQGENSRYGVPLEISYPHQDIESLIPAMCDALPAWRDAGPQRRTGLCLEILNRIHRMSFQMAHAVMHSTGQPFVMAFQAGGPHAQDRALEAISYAYAEMTRHAERSEWNKPAGRGQSLRLSKTFNVVPRGIALVIGCATFPTWNGYPGLFASLVTGNPVVVKPSPQAVLPLALTVRVCREVLAEYGFDPNTVCLAVESPQEALASALATHPAVRIVDFTGSSEYGEWLENNARQAQVYTEKSGVNTVIVDSTDDFAGMCRNVAFSLSLYSGQMCTTPQNILIPRAGVPTDQGHKDFEEVADGIALAVTELLADDARAVDVLGSLVSDKVLADLSAAESAAPAQLVSRPVSHPNFPSAVARSPYIGHLDVRDQEIYGREWFGPVSFVIATTDTAESIDTFAETTRSFGALTAAVYSTDDRVLADTERAANDVGVALSCNLTSGVFVNQSAAFSDFHGTGANPAANSCLTDPAFVAGRFRVVQSRRPAVGDGEEVAH